MASLLLEQGNLRTKRKRMEDIREQQDSGNPALKKYPRTLKQRADRLLDSTHCIDDFYYKKTSLGSPKKVEFKNCYLTNVDYIPDEYKSLKTIQKLNSIDENGVPAFKRLPVYLIMGHSSVNARITLNPPENMTKDNIKDWREYVYSDQLTQGKFSLDMADPKYNRRFTNKTDFFSTNPSSNKFIISASPVGFYATCGDKNENRFFKEMSLDNFGTFRKILMSENFSQFFNKNNLSADDESSYSTRWFKNVLYFPPGYSVLNKTYQFWDKRTTLDRWGVVRLDTLTQRDVRNGALDSYKPPIQTDTIEKRLEVISEFCVESLKPRIIESIQQKKSVSLKEITDTLGEGIYLDIGCSGLDILMLDILNKRYEYLNPRSENSQDITDYLPFYNAIQEALDEINRYTKLSWNNIVSTKETPSLTDDQTRAIGISEKFRRATNPLQRRFQQQQVYTERHMSGGKKKTRKRRKNKMRRKKKKSRKSHKKGKTRRTKNSNKKRKTKKYRRR